MHILESWEHFYLKQGRKELYHPKFALLHNVLEFLFNFGNFLFLGFVLVYLTNFSAWFVHSLICLMHMC